MCCGDGGGGSGGRIAIQFKTVSSHGALVTVVAPGTSGTTGASHGDLSAAAMGGPGIFTYSHIDVSQLTIGASESVHKGATVIMATRLTDGGTGSGIATASVGLYRRLLPNGSWTLASTKSTSAGGQAHTTVKAVGSAQYEWRYLGGPIHDAVTSSIQTVLVK